MSNESDATIGKLYYENPTGNAGVFESSGSLLPADVGYLEAIDITQASEKAQLDHG